MRFKKKLAWIKSKMSLSESVTKAVDGIIHSFIEQVASKYNIEPTELLSIWEGKSIVSKTQPSKSIITDIPSATDELDPETLLKSKKPEIQALCRQRGLKTTGTKEELIALLIGKKDTLPKKTETTAVTQPKKTTTKKTKPEPETPVVKKLTGNITTVAIRRNQFGHHEHPETSLVFDTKTRKVIGKQNDDGTVADLTPEDIDTCNQYKFKFTRPENLEKKMKLDDVAVDELDDEDDVIEDSDEEIDEDELIEDEDEDFDLEEEVVDDEIFD